MGNPQTVSLALDAVRAQAARFAGEMEQMPPPFSAKKIDGKPAYKLARQGKTPELKPVRITVDSFTVERVEDDTAWFQMRISAGGYVRAIAHAMGQELGCGAHLASLRRTAAGPFTLEQALPLDQVEALGAERKLEEMMPHPRTLLPEMPPVTADEQTVGRIRNGMQVNLPEYSQAPLVKIFEGQRDLVAVGRRVAGTLFQPFVVLV
jgi:tRNA pseudouridine55 synthase